MNVTRTPLPALLGLALSCSPPTPNIGPDNQSGGGQSQEQCPLFERDPMKEPDLMAWDPTQRQKINEKRDQGVVVVRMEKTGCDVTARVVDCVGKVQSSGEPYAFKWYYTSDTVYADTQREAYTKLPLGAASLGGEIGAGRSLRVDFVMAGSYVLPEGSDVNEWVGRECDQATHYVKRVVVGGFARASGDREAVHADVGLFGVGAGAGQQTSRLHWRTEGSPKACREAEEQKSASAGCDMPLRLELEPIPGREPVVEQPVAQPEPQPQPQPVTPPPAPSPTQPPPAQPPPVATSSCPSGMVWIAGGRFTMGSSTPAEVEGFCMDVTEVTVDAYARCSGCTNPDTGQYCNWGKSGRGNHPVNCVDWGQAVAYCRAMGKRLPTEAEWEYAARGGSRQLEYPWGSEAPGNRACWDGEGNDLGKGKRQGTCPVGRYAAGAFGLKDMAGNVWEWVQDWHGDYPSTVSKNYAGPSSGSYRVDRGGGWGVGDPSFLRGSFRSNDTPDYRDYNVGFRCARTR